MCFASPVPSLSSPPFPSGLPPSLALSSHSHFSHPSAPLPFIFPASYIATFAYPTLPLSSLPLSLSLPHSLTHSSSPLSPHVALNSLFYLYSLSLSLPFLPSIILCPSLLLALLLYRPMRSFRIWCFAVFKLPAVSLFFLSLPNPLLPAFNARFHFLLHLFFILIFPSPIYVPSIMLLLLLLPRIRSRKPDINSPSFFFRMCSKVFQ